MNPNPIDKNPNPVNKNPTRLEKIFTWTQILYMIRIPILIGAGIFLFPLVVVFIAPTLFRGLYDMERPFFFTSFWFSLFIFLFAWTIMITVKLVLFYGTERLGLESHIQTWFRRTVRKKWLIKYRVTFIVVLIGALFTLSGIFWINKDIKLSADYLWFYLLSGIAAGFVVALVILFVIDYVQSRLYKPKDAVSLRYMLYPFPSKLLERARRKPQKWVLKTRFLSENRFVKWLKSSRIIGRGYFCYDRPGTPFQGGHTTAIFLSIVYFLIYVGFGVFWIIFEQLNYVISYGVPAIVYVPILAAVLCWIFGAMAFFLDSYRIPLLTFVIIWLFFMPSPGHRYQLKTLAQPPLKASTDKPDLPESLVNKKLPGPQEVVEAADRNQVVQYEELQNKNSAPGRTPDQRSLPSAPKEDYIILVAADGGGIHAAAWTARVLTGLEQKCRESFNDSCGNKIRLISSVSGGSIGAMYFVDAYTEKGLPTEPRELEQILERTERSSLKYVAWGLAYPDFIFNLLPVNRLIPAIDTDRGRQLESGWLSNYAESNAANAVDQKKRLEAPLSTWTREVRENGWRPAIIFNTTIAETGERFLISTSDIKERTETSVTDSKDCQNLIDENFKRANAGSRSFNEVFPCNDISIVTAARLSATFPYVTPAARSDIYDIKGGPNYHNYNKAHIVDGGYYDNYGIVSLSEWMDELIKKQTGQNKKPKILVVQIRCNDTGFEAIDKTSDNLFYQIFAPLGTLYNARTNGQRSRGDLEFDILQRYWNEKNDGKDATIRSVVFNFAADSQEERVKGQIDSKEKYEPPLSWHMSADDKDKINNAWNNNPGAWQSFKKIIECYRGSGDPKSCPAS